ncbi:MAG: serine/threonine protein kinase [Nitrospirota bacterium]
MGAKVKHVIEAFDLDPGRKLVGKYEVVSRLGSGWEGEVYKIVEVRTGYVEGELLSEFLAMLPGRRLSPFEGVHLLYALARGIEQIHLQNEYHGDLHAENVIVSRYGLTFDVKLLDLYQWHGPRSENKQQDILDLIRIFYDSLGGQRLYRRQPEAVRYICSGLKRSLILGKFRTMSQLREHLETMEW